MANVVFVYLTTAVSHSKICRSCVAKQSSESSLGICTEYCVDKVAQYKWLFLVVNCSLDFIQILHRADIGWHFVFIPHLSAVLAFSTIN